MAFASCCHVFVFGFSFASFLRRAVRVWRLNSGSLLALLAINWPNDGAIVLLQSGSHNNPLFICKEVSFSFVTPITTNNYIVLCVADSVVFPVQMITCALSFISRTKFGPIYRTCTVMALEDGGEMQKFFIRNFYISDSYFGTTQKATIQTFIRTKCWST